MAARLVTPPTEEPISLEEAKSHLRVEHAEDDGLIGSYVAAARNHLELMTGRAFVTQTWEAVFKGFPCREIDLVTVPVQSVESVKYDDVSGAEQTLTEDAYELDNMRDPAWVITRAGNSWPFTICSASAVRVRFVAGYGEASAVPVSIKQAIKLLVGHWYANREAVAVGKAASDLPLGTAALIAPFRRWSI